MNGCYQTCYCGCLRRILNSNGRSSQMHYRWNPRIINNGEPSVWICFMDTNTAAALLMRPPTCMGTEMNRMMRASAARKTTCSAPLGERARECSIYTHTVHCWSIGSSRWSSDSIFFHSEKKPLLLRVQIRTDHPFAGLNGLGPCLRSSQDRKSVV